jgi:hypothetical protein
VPRHQQWGVASGSFPKKVALCLKPLKKANPTLKKQHKPNKKAYLRLLIVRIAVA